MYDFILFAASASPNAYNEQANIAPARSDFRLYKQTEAERAPRFYKPPDSLTRYRTVTNTHIRGQVPSCRRYAFKSVYRLAAVGSAQRIAGIDPHELIPVIHKAQQISIYSPRAPPSTCATLLRISGLQSRESLSSSGYTELSIFIPSRSFRKSIFCRLRFAWFRAPYNISHCQRTACGFERGLVEFIVIEHELAVDKHFLYAERLRLIGRCVLSIVLIEHGEIGEIAGFTYPRSLSMNLSAVAPVMRRTVLGRVSPVPLRESRRNFG